MILDARSSKQAVYSKKQQAVVGRKTLVFWNGSSNFCAGVQPQWIQGVRSRDGVGEDQETIA